MSHYGQDQQYGQGGYYPPPQQQYAPPPQQQQYAPSPQHQQYAPPPQQQYATPPPPAAGPAAATAAHSSDSGSFPGGTYQIAHRDTNAILNLDIHQGSGAIIKAKPGAMVHMSGTVQLTGQVKFSMKKMFTGGEMAESSFAGHGRVALAPVLQGDIVTLHIDGSTHWKIGKDAFLACTQGVSKDTKSQGLGKAFFSGEDLFIYHVLGQGLLWLTSYGAVDRIDLQPGEDHIVDNGHLVAWSADYRIERAGGGSMTSLKTGEGLVCRFTGPGAVYIQTRNKDEFKAFIGKQTATSG